MKNYLHEVRMRGTPLYNFENYSFKKPTGNFFVTEHWHEELEIIEIQAGTLALTIDGQYYKGKAGEIYIINSEEIHEMHTSDAETVYNAYVFPMSFLNFREEDEAQAKYINPIMNKQLRFANTIKPEDTGYEEILSELKQLRSANESRAEGYSLLTKACLYKIFVQLYRIKAIKDSNVIDRSIGERTEQLKRIIIYVKEHYAEKLLLKNVASEFYMSDKYFCRYFKNAFQKTFVEYVNYVRIAKASERLLKTEDKVLEVALSCGFENFSYFIRKFKEIQGMTPTVYRTINKRQP